MTETLRLFTPRRLSAFRAHREVSLPGLRSASMAIRGAEII
jgi:hypothetical protein